MLSSRLVDTTDKCDIIKTSLKDDLYPYTISSDGSIINYSNGSSLVINYNQLSAIGTLASQSYSSINTDAMADCWLPVIVDSDTYVSNKMLSDDGSYANANPALSSGRLGIENFLSFTPSFRNFSNVGQMSIDWLLSRHNVPYAVYYGIMCWVRRNSTSNVMTIGGSSAKLETFPKGTRLKHSSRPNDILIKIDNNTLFVVNSQRYVVGTSITYNDENTFILQAGTITPDNYSLADKSIKETWTTLSTTTSTETLDGFPIQGLTNNVRLWIPDGDCFFYYESEPEKIVAEAAGVPTNGFISPCLTRYYTSIYRVLTLDQPRSFAKKNLKISRCYRKIAHALSTSPFIGEFAIRALDCKDIKGIVDTYVSSSALSRDINQEKTLLKTALKDISLYLQKTITTGNGTSNTGIYIDTKPSPYSLNNNLIANKSQLFNKLITKYGAGLLISSSSTLIVNNSLFKDNTGVVITQAMDYYCPKNTTNSLLFNNQRISYDGTTIQTVMSSTESKLSIQNTIDREETVSIPLYDIAKPDIDGNNSLICPTLLYLGYIEKRYMSNDVLYHPPNTLINASLVYKYAMKTSSYIAIDGTIKDNPVLIKGEEAGPELDAMDLLLNVRDDDSLLLHETYIENQMSFYWEKLSGPEDCEFIENNGGFINSAKPSNTTANSRFIQLKIKNSGKYVVQCTVNSPYGTFKKQKTIYVYDGADLIERYNDNGAPATYVPNPMINKWYDENNQIWTTVPVIPENDPEFQPIPLNRDKLRVRCSKFSRVAISQVGGVFAPIKTGFTVKEFIGMAGSAPAKEVTKLDELYKFSTKKAFTPTTSASLSITYTLESNTIAKILSIYIEKVRSNATGCEQCYSLYEPKLRAEKTTVFTGSSRVNAVRYNRINKSPEGFLFYKYKSNIDGTSANSIETVSFGYPEITTKNSPPVKTYGGYNLSTINSFNIQNNINNTVYNSIIPGLPTPTVNVGDTNSIAAAQPSTLPPVTGFPLDVANDEIPGKHKLCYQRQLPYVGGGPITFNKGVLHPNSGWIPHTSDDYAIHANRSSVLKFNPGARSTFSFIGPKLSNISSTSANISNNVVEPNILSSSIDLKISPGVQWDPDCECASSPGGSVQMYNDNQKHKEYIDTTTNRSSHGYRYLNGGQPKPLERTALTNEATYNDEFGTDQDEDTFSYSFAVTGPASVPDEIDGDDGRKHLRIPTVKDFGIKDIEVKLNFLNYVNTKNLVIWLEVQPDASESSSRNRPDRNGIYPSPIRAPQKFLDQTIPPTMVSGTSYQSSINSSQLYANIPNNKIANYLDCLLNAQSGVAGGPLRLLLLNQEHIENNGYNLSVKFTDSASKYNVLYDQNLVNGTPATSGTFFPPNQLANIDKHQKIVRNNGIVRPSLAANSYSDRESCEFSKILRNNRLNVTAASFSKFNTNTLFRNILPLQGPCPERAPKQKQGDLGGVTKFTLKIMVLDETDDMSPNDTLINNQYLTGLESAEKTQSSTDIFNSLCNWELILHVGDVPKFVPHTNPNLASYGNCDSLSLLDYSKNLKYPGYSFIADLTNYQHLLPLANIDAPNTAISDTSLCLTTKNDPISRGFVVKPYEKFPDWAIVQIVAALLPGTTGTLIGTAMVPGLGYGQGFNAIVSWFGESRFLSNLEDSGRQIFTQSYTKYPFGSPEKILLNVKKSDSLWYSLEATIMKYHNTPLLQLKKHNYVKVQRGISKYATEFNFDTISDYQDLLDLKNIPEVSLSCAGTLPFPRATITYPTASYGNYIINYGDLVNVTVTGCPAPNNNDGLYVALDTGWSKITNQSIGDLTKSISFLKYNSVLSYNNSLFYNGLKDDITALKVIICSTRIPYDIFFVGDTVECYAKDDRLLSSGGSIINPSIVKKGLINKNNKLYSVFVLDTAITSQNTISPTPQTNTLLLYSNNTTRENNINKDYNAWGLDSNGYIKETPPYAGFSAHSVGSYGNVSPFVNKNLLDKNFRYNSLQPTHKILNNHENDKIQKNKVKVYGYSNDSLSEVTSFTNDMACGFSYNENDLYDSSVFQTKTSNVVVAPENTRQVDGDFSVLSDSLFEQIKKTTGYNENNYSFMYLRTSSSSSNTATPLPDDTTTSPPDDTTPAPPPSTPIPAIPFSGYVSIENDYEEYIPVKFIDLTDISARLNTIDTLKIQPLLENVVGDPNQTATILASSNIKYIETHLKKLIKDDPSSCHRVGAVIADCPKLRTQTKLNKLYSERTDLIKLLEEQAVQSASVAYVDDSGNTQNVSGTIVAESATSISLNIAGTTRKIIKSNIINTDTQYGLVRSFIRKDRLEANHVHKLPPDILPKIEPIITTNTDNSINIQYSGVNLNHYWINIDPKQSCVLDFTSNPKVLDSTEYFCIRANVSASNLAGSELAADNNVCPEFAVRQRVPQFPDDAIGDEGFSIKGRQYKYMIPFNTIETNKETLASQYPAITGWTKFTKERYFNINADNSLGFDGVGVETTVRSQETYWIPLVDNTPINNDNSADAQSVTGIEQCQTNLGSPGGFGLISSNYRERVGTSTRVQNVFNLDDVNSIDVQIKRIPRLLRGCDVLGTVYRYGNRNIFRQQSLANPRVPFEVDGIGVSGPLNNGLYCWICLQQRLSDNSLRYAPLPPFLQHQNEMMFRSFFGSIDRIENRTDLMVSYYPWELIPYEYAAAR
jgi:hypothetical protein